MSDLTTSIKRFASLNRAPGATWTNATKRKAPHKPLLLLAVLDLVQERHHLSRLDRQLDEGLLRSCRAGKGGRR